MSNSLFKSLVRVVAILVFIQGIPHPATAGDNPPIPRNNQPLANPSGSAATFSTHGAIERDNEFFQVLGSNGRTCATCHHNGRAANLAGVVDFYETRFGLGLDNRQRLDLISFLEAL